jgi:hypothetical protein
MKFNKWTLGLAAVGVVSLASVAQAEEQNALQTALSTTTISGYVDTSAQWNFGSDDVIFPFYKYGGASKADGFNLNVVQLSIAKPLDESEWAAGYKVDMWMGPDASTLGTSSDWSSSDFALKQAYVALRTPVGNGLDFKMGVFDSIIGYESSESGNNPNYTRSFGHSIEPSTHTGLLATYRFTDWFSAAAGIANTVNPVINSRAQDGSSGVFGGLVASLASAAGITLPPSGTTEGWNDKSESLKSYMGSVALTAPEDWGWVAGSTLYAGVVGGYNNSFFGSSLGLSQINYYAGLTLATPVTGLKLGAALDYLSVDTEFNTPFTTVEDVEIDIWTAALYASYQATEKLSLHVRGEYLEPKGSNIIIAGGDDIESDFWAATATVQYDLWQNVISRLEVRWDYSEDGIYGDPFSDDNEHSMWMVAANVIYKF